MIKDNAGTEDRLFLAFGVAATLAVTFMVATGDYWYAAITAALGSAILILRYFAGDDF